MGGTPNPLAQQILSSLASRSMGGGQPGAGIESPMEGGVHGQPGAGEQYAAQVSELKGADPGGLVAQLKKLKQIFAVMLVQNLERLPNVSGQVSKIIPMIDKVIKEAQQGASVNQAVRNPIQLGAAQPQPGTEGGGNPSPGLF